MTPNRLHPLALLIMLGKGLYGWAAISLASAWAILKDADSRWWSLPLAAVALIAFVVIYVLRYLRFTYVLGEDAITINSGLFVRKTRHIPYANIQTLKRSQWLILQPFDLLSLSIETSGHEDNDAEAELVAVPTAVAATIERRRKQTSDQPTAAGQALVAASVTADSTAVTPPATGQATGDGTAPAGDNPAAANQVIAAEAADQIAAGVTTSPNAAPDTAVPDATYRIAARDLNLYALTSMGFVPIIAVLFWLYDKTDDFLPKGWVQGAEQQLAALAVVVLVALGLLVLLLGIAAAYLGILQKYYQFTLRRDGHTLTATRGLFNRTTTSVRIARIQAVRVRATLLRQWCHLASVQALTASNAADDEKDNDLVLMPVVQSRQLLPVMAPFVPWLPTALPPLTGPAATAPFVRNAVLGYLGLGLAVAFGLHFWQPHWVPIVLVVTVVLALVGLLQGRYAGRTQGVATHGSLLIAQTGSWGTRQTDFMRRANIQSLSVEQPRWLRSRERCHLTINLRRANHNEAIELRYLSLAAASPPGDAAFWCLRAIRPRDGGGAARPRLQPSPSAASRPWSPRVAMRRRFAAGCCCRRPWFRQRYPPCYRRCRRRRLHCPGRRSLRCRHRLRCR
ncbi:PH domain-containing protein [Lacticaseibacillus parakribbianus]|uniref:PH domain-containing protein n=1 Tax=Lacticaseibacillus parakribbianus TaxID=2970927 RepID=UPI0021CB8DFC|nr:PH domain-containing protein [Lacticaseibacillus parakribbianus]